MEMTLAITRCVTWMANAYKFMGKDFITALMTGWKPRGRFGSVSVTRCWKVQQMSMADDSKLKLWFFLLCIMIRIICDYKGANRLHAKSVTSEIRHLMNIDVGRLLQISTVAQIGQNDFNSNLFNSFNTRYHG